MRVRAWLEDWVTDYIDDIPPESYVNAYFKGCRYGRTTSTLAESFNSGIMIHKKMHVSALLDHRKDSQSGPRALDLHLSKVACIRVPCAHALASI
ncbi:hypothetical protein C5167_031183 [Papaver somniferum]|nr:hypothetical protein C5167_031183 [Papaver somniferum]